MKTIWKIEDLGYSYAGSFDAIGPIERKEHNFTFDEWTKNKKRFFLEREDAENYVRPLAKLAYEYFINDWIANLDEDEDMETIEEYKRRGFQEWRTEELDSDHDYFNETPTTIFLVPSENEYDRIGVVFATIKFIEVY